MDRREFIQDSLLLAGTMVLPVNRGWASPLEKLSKLSVGYIREQIPAFDVPPYVGARYIDEIPDTLDIAERARLGVNCLTGITDPLADQEIFWSADFYRNPPVMVHDFSDWCQNVEGMMESLPLLRVASGSTQNSDVDRTWMEVLLKSIGPDGLVYIPLEGRPWGRKNSCWVTPIWRADGTTTDISDTSVRQVTNPNLWPRAISAMMIYQIRDGNPMWHQAVENMIQGMSRLVSDQGDYAYFPPGGFEPNMHFSGGSAGRQEMPTGFLALDGGNVRVVQGLAKYYRLTGYEPARVLARKLVNFVKFHSDAYDAHGRFRFSAFEKANPQWFVDYSRAHGGTTTLEEVESQTLGGHFHSHTLGVLCILEYAMAVNDRESLEWCRSSYEWAKTQGNPLIGFFPEFIVPGYPSCESCEVADMIGIAAKLTQAGIGDYWDDMDRWARNQFAENQLTDGDWIYEQNPSIPKKAVAFNETAENVAQRNLGAFAGWASANEWALHNGIMHCCTGNSTRAIYYIWENIVHATSDELKINLLLNRASGSADIYSYIPYQGRVKVRMKRPHARVLLRVPEWIESGSSDVRCTVNGDPRSFSWNGRYINLGSAKSTDLIEVTFPIASRSVAATIGTTRYNLEIKGNTIVSVDPPGHHGALYQRAAYRSSEAPVRKLQRFAPNSEITC